MPLRAAAWWLGKAATLHSFVFSTLVAIFICIGVFFTYAAVMAWEASDDRQRSYEAVLVLERLMVAACDAETGQRGYLLAGGRSYLEPYERALRELGALLEQTRAFVPFPHDMVDRLGSDIDAKCAELAETIRLRDAGDQARALAIVRTGRGKHLMGAIRRDINTLIAAETARLRRSDARLRVGIRLAVGGGSAGVVVFCWLMVWLTLRNRRDEQLRRATEQYAQAAEEKFIRVVEMAPNAVIIAGRDGIINFWNRAATSMFQADMLGRRLVEIMPERYRARYAQWFEFANRSGKLRAPGREYQMEALRLDGSEFSVELSVDRVDVAGEPLYVAIMRDVTERYRVLAELERSNEELEQFAYVASHDLQEPLRMVVQYLGRLRDKYGDQFDAQGLKYLNYAVDGGMRMRRLIEDLLVYARVTTKARPVEPVNTGDLVDVVIADVAALAGVEHGSVDVVTDMPVVDADPSQLRQVFMNLIANALKFHAPGASPEVKVSAAADDGFWRFSIADNGIGIDPIAGRRLFMLFTRLHARDEYAGTGIGLAICKKIVLRHEGRIWFESTPGQGTTFHFTLPREVKDRP